VIAETEARRRMEYIISSSLNKVMTDFPEADENQLVAIMSVFYNCN
jgi:hypothetical protein